MASPTNILGFNPEPPSVMHVDLNSCFASVEQQANPHLRGKPIAVVAYDSPGGCILASSIEAKALGIKTGHRVRDGKKIYPKLITLPADPNKYRHVHQRFSSLLSNFTSSFHPKSIDEFVLHFQNHHTFNRGLAQVGQEIKHRIKSEIGDNLTVSIGIGPNRFLAKTASNLKKPDGLEEINKDNYLQVYKNLTLTDLHGINIRNEARLRSAHIYSVLDFYHAKPQQLKVAFRSVLAKYWFSRLRGYEIDNLEFSRKSFGNSYSLPARLSCEAAGGPHSYDYLYPILQKLVEKTGFRLRTNGYKATGIHLALRFRDNTYWHKDKTLKKVLFSSTDIYTEMVRLLGHCPSTQPIHTIHETCFGLVSSSHTQLELFEDIPKKENLTSSLDQINSRWGNFIITPARMLLAQDKVPDRIGFGLAN